MNIDERSIKTIFPNASTSFIKANSSKIKWNGAHPFIQEQQDAIQKQENRSHVRGNKSKKQSVDGNGIRQFSITIEFLMSDKRGRDLDGSCATILDTLIATRGRFMDSHTGNKS